MTRHRTVVCSCLRHRMALVAAGLGLTACSEPGGPARCATEVAPDVCATAPNLRGVEAVPEEWTLDPVPELIPQPLVEGRYVLTARRQHCDGERDLPASSQNVLRVVEIVGCVMRTTTVIPPEEESYIGVGTFDYTDDGRLEVTVACLEDERQTYRSGFGFDGVTLVMIDASEDGGPPLPGGDCVLVNTLELR